MHAQFRKERGLRLTFLACSSQCLHILLGLVQNVRLHSPDMRQHIAWQLAYRGMMHAKIAEASRKAREESKATEVKNVHVTLEVGWAISHRRNMGACPSRHAANWTLGLAMQVTCQVLCGSLHGLCTARCAAVIAAWQVATGSALPAPPLRVKP